MASNQLNVQAPVAQAVQLLPRRLTIDTTTLELSGQRTAEAAFYGRDARRFRASWTRGQVTGDAYVEVRPLSERGSELVVDLRAPSGLWGRVVWSASLTRLSLRLARALRYEIETRAAEETDAFTSRRTTSALVKERIA